jgi:hypothetical protein
MNNDDYLRLEEAFKIFFASITLFVRQFPILHNSAFRQLFLYEFFVTFPGVIKTKYSLQSITVLTFSDISP